MPKRNSPDALGARERQIMDVVYQIGEASVAEILEKLPDPPSYSAVRTMVRLLESKGFLTHRQEGTRYVYRASQSRDTAMRQAVSHLMKTFFAGSATDAVAAILHPSVAKLTDDDIQRLEGLIQQARKKGK